MTEALKKCNANVDEVKLQWKLQVNDEVLAKSYEQGVKLGKKALEVGK
ncbi:A-type_flavoprotein [Hexamita inflata]|uniref:A-type flavoprotein n=1 Tax=Hexamita inflata TaxID=28002 RepID=A0AA86P126_9EUKA|nr:A-type flavoprotein [Hexamita inflata]